MGNIPSLRLEGKHFNLQLSSCKFTNDNLQFIIGLFTIECLQVKSDNLQATSYLLNCTL